MRAGLGVVLGLGAMLVAAPAFGQAAVSVRTTPAVPLRGSLAWLQVMSDPAGARDSLLDVEGEAAGEPLHFRRETGGFRALVGVPLELADSLALRLRLVRPGRTDTTIVAFPLAMPVLGTERLRVPPTMVEYDSATRARIDGEIARAVNVSRRAHETPRLWGARFELPRASRITSVYGTAREYNGEITSRHMGTDFAGRVGEPVHAAGRGVVALVADFYLAGRAVYLDHGEGLVTGYFHLSRIDVSEGDTVVIGTRIGAVGRTGRVTGPHLHWIVRYGAISVDPMSLVRVQTGQSD